MTEVQSTHPNRSPHALYRFYSDSGQLLYVGITNNPGARFSQHQADKPWWHDVAGISVEKHETRQDALAAEARAIEVERPLHNKVRPRLASKRKAAAAPTRHLVWKCNACDMPVEGTSGYIHINEADVAAAEIAESEIEERIASRDGFASRVWTGADLADLPDVVRWQVHHRDCDPDPGSDDYWFEVARAATHAHLLSWTAHLMGKSWLNVTDWDHFIRRAAGVDA